jgi:DNA-binding HxlR family transcriptional regulator
MPFKVEYVLTTLGRSMESLLDEVLKWGIHFRKEVTEIRLFILLAVLIDCPNS